ncbi:MAG: hypothetical protein K0Q43_519 [Ramlibacter sp.]|jgi:hypothetical protein|nr:hypothetical protein [Ramlibacter sp.]
MQLTLHPSTGAVRSFWVTRRQWLSLLDAVLALRLADEAAPDTIAAVPGAKKRLPAAALDEAVSLQALRLRPTAGGGAKLAFVAGENGAAMSLQPPGLHRLKHMLLEQAERAEWDAVAAMDRLGARKIAGDALNKARRAD